MAIYTATCDDCEQIIEITATGIAKAHKDKDGKEACPGSGLRPLHVPSYGVWEISGGHFEGNRDRH